MRKKAINICFLLVLCTIFSVAAGAEVPDWLRNLSKQPGKSYAEDVNGVILVNDQTTTVRENGEIIHHGRFALKILRPEGRDAVRTAVLLLVGLGIERRPPDHLEGDQVVVDRVGVLGQVDVDPVLHRTHLRRLRRLFPEMHGVQVRWFESCGLGVGQNLLAENAGSDAIQ